MVVIILTGCQCNNAEIESLKKENEQSKQKNEEMTKDTDKLNIIKNKTEFNAMFADDDTSMIFWEC